LGGCAQALVPVDDDFPQGNEQTFVFSRITRTLLTAGAAPVEEAADGDDRTQQAK
jgi:hypothetical protein